MPEENVQANTHREVVQREPRKQRESDVIQAAKLQVWLRWVRQGENVFMEVGGQGPCYHSEGD